MVVVVVKVSFGVGVKVVVVVVVAVGVAVAVAVGVKYFINNFNGGIMKISGGIMKTGEGLEKLAGEVVTLFCANYIYSGKLTGINDDCVLLSDAGIVYETGELTVKTWKDRQPLPNDCYIMKNAIESFMILK